MPAPTTYFGRTRSLLGKNYIEIRMPELVSHFLLVTTSAYLAANKASASSLLACLKEADALAVDVDVTVDALYTATHGALDKSELSSIVADYQYRITTGQDALPTMRSEAAWMIDRKLVTEQSVADFESRFDTSLF